MRWTKRDEVQLNELINRRNTVMTEMRKPLEAFVATLPHGCLPENGEALVIEMTTRADELTMALLPFTSGVVGTT